MDFRYSIHSFLSFFFYIYKITAIKRVFKCPIISIGNISVGGTGKSVLTAFLADKIKFACFGVILRGYKKRKKEKKAILVSSRSHQSNYFGDEALMLAQKLSVPVWVSSNRGNVIKRYQDRSFGYFILDDAYQQFSFYSTCSILILDARHPFENGWTLPAGLLREKDISRADIIVFSHAHFLSSNDRKKFSNQICKKVKENKPIFFVKHQLSGLKGWSEQKGFFSVANIDSVSVCALAGIGSFDQFIQTVQKLSVSIVVELEYADHYTYTLEDIDAIMHALNQAKISTIITTEKDWVKLYPLLQVWHTKNKKSECIWIIVQVTIAFINAAEERIFLRLVQKKVITWFLKQE